MNFELLLMFYFLNRQVFRIFVGISIIGSGWVGGLGWVGSGQKFLSCDGLGWMGQLVGWVGSGD